jgi:glycosyltransferase involved in cell wall biosynthesis
VSQARRVAIDLRPLARGPVTGVGLLIAQILEELRARGVEFIGLCDRPIPEERVPRGMRVHVRTSSGGRIRWEALALPRLLRELSPAPDLYHATWNHGVPAGLPFPSLLSLHDLIPWRLPRQVPWPRPAVLHRAIYRAAVRRSARAAASIVTLSEASRRDIVARIPDVAGRVEVIPCAVPRWFTPAPPERVREYAARFGGEGYWVYFGGFDPRKGLDALLTAAHRAFPDPAAAPRWVLAGAAGGEARRLEALAKALRVPAQFPGYVADQELAALLQGAALFVYPSLYEGFGIPPLLAMAAGVACLVSDGGALPEVAADAAIVTPAGDVEALARALRRVASEPGWAASHAARGPARARAFSVEALAERMTRAYGRAAASP